MQELGGGAYNLYPVYLQMAGLWEVTLEITPMGGTRDSVVFLFCIQG